MDIYLDHESSHNPTYEVLCVYNKSSSQLMGRVGVNLCVTQLWELTILPFQTVCWVVEAIKNGGWISCEDVVMLLVNDFHVLAIGCLYRHVDVGVHCPCTFIYSSSSSVRRIPVAVWPFHSLLLPSWASIKKRNKEVDTPNTVALDSSSTSLSWNLEGIRKQ